MITGYSTGSLYKNVPPVSGAAIDLVRRSGSRAIELCASRVDRVKSLMELPQGFLEGFQHVTIHAPVDVKYADDTHTKSLLEMLSEAYHRHDCKRIVFEPDTIQDPSLLDGFDCQVAFENLGGKAYNDIQSMLPIFQGNERTMVLDMTHAFLVDPTLQLAKGFHNRFADRIVQYHLGGCRKHPDDGQHHYPISETRQDGLLEAILLDKPVIIESVFPRHGDHERLMASMKTELEYARAFLKRRFAVY